MLEQINNAGPCATACKPRAGTGKGSTVFESITVSARTNAPPNDDLLHGRVRLCRVCRTETTNDRYCDACLADGTELRTCIRCGQEFDAFGPRKAMSDDLCLTCLEDDARREERAAALEGRCRIHRVRYVEDLPVSVLEEMQAERGRC
jgi:hypothetical protein